MTTRRPRPSGFTDAELAAAAWKRNMQMRGTMAQESELLREKGAKKAERKKKNKAHLDGEERKGRKAKRKKGKRGERSRSVSMGSADSLGRERKARRSRSPGGNSSDGSRERKHNSRRGKRARERSDHNAEFEEMEKALGWRAAMARASRSPSIDPVGGEDKQKGWSSSSSAGSFTSDRGTDGESDVEPSGIIEEMIRSDVGPPVAGLLGGAADVPPDPLRIEHDDRERRWRGGWQRGVSVGIMARGVHGSGIGGASRNYSGQGRGRRRDLDEGEFYRERGRGRRSSRERKRRSRSRSPGGEDSARSLSRSISRDRRSRRSSRSHSPSCRRSRSRDRTVWSLIQQFRGNDNPSDVTGGKPENRADSVRSWTHDLYEETTGDSPPRPTLPPGWKPEPESWVSRAGGVYLPVKPPP